MINPTRAQRDELAAIYVKVPKLVSAFCTERMMPTYSRSLERQLARDAITDSPADIQGELDALGSQLERLVLTLIPELRSWVIRQQKWHAARWAANVKTATTVVLSTLIGPEDVATTMQAVLARNIALITNVADEAKAKVADAVWRGFQARSAARDVAKEITETMQVSRRRGINIASDQMQKLSSALDGERLRQAGIGEWIWRWSHKLHGRKEHIARDGNHYTDATAPSDLPGMLPFCGCKRQAFVKFD